MPKIFEAILNAPESLPTSRLGSPLEANAGPQEVFGVIEDALRIHFAKKQTELIEG